MRIAAVIVDVSAYAIDRPFDYLIPPEIEQDIQQGSRVKVPFGSRKLVGYVIEIKEETTMDSEKLKPIDELIDIVPVLTAELLELAQFLARETICYTIDALQMMLPAAMRATYTKNIHQLVALEQLPAELQMLFTTHSVIPYEHLTTEQQKSCKQAIQEGLLDIETKIEQQTKKKKERVILIPSRQELEEGRSLISNQAKKQHLLLEWLIAHASEQYSVRQIQQSANVSPAIVQALVDKDLIKIHEQEVYRELTSPLLAYDQKLTLTAQQQQAFEAIQEAVVSNRNETFLLHGITGSGKTEVYLQVIEEVLKQEKETIMLVPEIALTPQMTARFKGRFGDQVAVLHSGLSQGEKYDEWRKIRRGEVKVAVGARSAVFAPFENLGLIILDEEHEGTYKQEELPRYHARDVAKWRAAYYECPVILGSATPALETYARARKGVYTLLEMTSRPKSLTLPTVEIVDMREELRAGNRSMYSHSLIDKIKEKIELKQQVVLFLNKRGFSSFLLCRECGMTVQCPACDVALTYHRSIERLKCHYCNYERNVPHECEECGSDSIRFFGTGTQKAEVELKELIPDARIIRMDVDTTSRKGMHEKLLKQFGDGEADILLGTQMIAKGLDFPRITLVGVLAADSALHLSDFRASEKTFQLITQVSGRAGRDQLAGEVVIQTYDPEHYAITRAADQAYLPFYQEEMVYRKRLGYPPFVYVVMIQFSHRELEQVIQYANQATRFLKEKLAADAFFVQGPAPAHIPRVNHNYRYQCFIKYKNDEGLLAVLNELMQIYRTQWVKKKLTMTINRDPQSM